MCACMGVHFCLCEDALLHVSIHVHSHTPSHAQPHTHIHTHTHTDGWVPELSFWGCLVYAVICLSMFNFIAEVSVSCGIAGKYGARACACTNVCETMCVHVFVHACVRCAFGRKGAHSVTGRSFRPHESDQLFEFS